MSLQSNILAKISGKEVRMHSRAYFLLLFVGFWVLLTLAFLALSFAAVSVLHVVREYGMLHLFSFGWEGVGGFLGAFPWELLALAILMLAGSYHLALRLRISYRKPFAYTLFGIALAAAAFDVLIMATPLYAAIFRSQVSPVARMMQAQRFMPRGFVPATVDHVQDGRVYVRSADGQEQEIEIEGAASVGEIVEPGDRVMLHMGHAATVKRADKIKKMGKSQEYRAGGLGAPAGKGRMK